MAGGPRRGAQRGSLGRLGHCHCLHRRWLRTRLGLADGADRAVVRSFGGVAGLTLPASRENIGFRYLSLRNPLAPLPAVLLRSRHLLFRLWTYLREGVGPSR